MRSRGVRVVILLLAIAALAAAGTAVWQIEERIASARAATDTFESDARQAVVSLGDWRAAQQAYVADGQPTQAWLAKAAGIGEALGPKLSALRAEAVTAEAQGALESAIEAFNALMRNDAKARDYTNAGQRFSASDVIFTESAPALERAVIGIDTARGQERVAFAVAFETLRRWELIAVGAAAGVLLLAALLLTPLPAVAAGEAGAEEPGEEIVIPRGAGLNLSHDAADGVVRGARPVEDVSPAEAPDRGPAAAGRTGPTLGSKRASRDAGLGAIDFSLDGPASPKGPDLEAIADLCSSLARVQDTRELQGLLDRAARALDAAGIIVWMPEGPRGVLRPVLTHGYAPLAVSRMGVIHPAADNATATAYRTKSVVVVPAELLESGAVVAPLISADGCSGAMAVELRGSVEPTAQVRAAATIVAAQLATMFTPGAAPSASPAGEAVAPDVAAGQAQ